LGFIAVLWMDMKGIWGHKGEFAATSKGTEAK
jgi:hypothetical protein